MDKWIGDQHEELFEGKITLTAGTGELFKIKNGRTK